ncbi:MAG: hypothetical protein WDO68_06040 [Gammaproteobacteria bacterium]
MERSTGLCNIPFLVGVTGHRDLVPEEVGPIRTAIHSLLERLVAAYPGARPTLLSSMAEGADLFAAEIAHELGLGLICLLPKSVALCRADLTSDASRAIFDRLVPISEQIQVAPAVSADELARFAPDLQRDLEFQHAGSLIARYSTLLIAVWDGKDAGHRAGTARVVQYRRRGMMANGTDEAQPVGNPLLAIQDNDLMYEIRCSRQSAPATDPGSVLVLGFTDRGESYGKDIPSLLTTVLRRIEEFNLDIARYSEAIRGQPDSLLCKTPEQIPPRLERLHATFCAADWLGRHYRNAFGSALQVRYWLWALMLLLLVSFKKENQGSIATTLILGVLATFAVGFLFAQWAHRKSWHRKYLDYRALAEGLRVEFYWQIAGVNPHGDGEFAHETFLQKQDDELEWIRAAMRSVTLPLESRDRSPPHSGLSVAIDEWVGEEGTAGSGQLAYYRARTTGLRRRLHITERLGHCLLIAGLLLALGFATEMLLRSRVEIFDAPIRTVLLWLLALLPVYAAILETYVSEKSDRSLIRQYKYMSRLFTTAARELRSTQSRGHRLQLLKSLGYACLAEHAQWILANRDKRIEGLRW